MTFEDRPARPWDLLNEKVGRVSEQKADKRYSICKDCEYLGKFSFCKRCGCNMRLKVTLPNAFCPAGFWGIEEKDGEW